MKRAVLLLAIALGCGEDREPAAQPTGSAAPAASTQAETPPSVDAVGEAARIPPRTERRIVPDPVRDGPPPPPDRPDVILLVNGQSDGAQVVAGWPVVVELQLSSPDGREWRVSGKGKPWSRLARVESPEATPWPLEPAGEVPDEVTVSGDRFASAFWTLAPDVSRALPRGERTLRAVLEWDVAVPSRALRVAVVDEPSPLPAAWAERKAEVEAEYALLREGAAAALARLEAATAAQRESWRLRAFRGHLLLRDGKRADGERAIREALALWQKQNPGGCSPPQELLVEQEPPVVPDDAEAAPPDVSERPPELPRDATEPERPAAPLAPAPPRPDEPEPEPLQVSGLILTPPRGWRRDDGSGVPAFRSEADPCRFFVLPTRPFQGTAKEAHDGLVAAILADHTLQGAAASGERHGFAWSAAEIRDAKGNRAWFTLFSIGRGSTLESVLFQADTKAAYDAHRGAVESMIDGAALADGAKREELEEAGNLRFARPAGWTRETRDGAEWLTPPGVPAGRVCTVMLSPGEELGGNARDWFGKTWDELVAGGKATGGELEVRRGERFDTLFRSAIVERGGRELFVTLVAFTPGTRIECLVYLADDRELFTRHLAAADALVAGIGFRNLDGPAPATPKLEGAWWRIEYAFDPSTRSREPQNYFLFFYEGGLASREWRAEGPDGLDPTREMALADTQWGAWGHRTEKDGEVAVRWANGGESTFTRGENGSLREGSSNPYLALPRVEGLPFDGLYRFGDGTLIQGASQFEIRFTRDGRFEEQNFCSCVHRDGPRAGKGRFRLANYTLHLEYDSGDRTRMGFHAFGTDGFHANNNHFSRAK